MEWGDRIDAALAGLGAWLAGLAPPELLALGAAGMAVLWLAARLFLKPQRGLEARIDGLAQALDGRLAESARGLDSALAQNRTATDAALAGLAERIGRIDAAQANLDDLSAQIVGLERTLGDKQARGAFGEARLGDLLRDALPAAVFKEQATLSNGRRADALVDLPRPPGPIAVDAKFPLESFTALIGAEDAAAEKAARRALERDVSKHVADIADRYIVPGETADCALMFVPSEAVYAEIHARCHGAVEAGWRRRVFIVSPTTLWALLNTIRAVMKDARIREESAALQAEAQALVADVAAIARAAEAARRRLELAEADMASLAASAKSAERRGERIRDLDLGDDDRA